MGFLLEPNGTQAICWTERTPKAGAINPRLFSCPLFCDLFHTIVLSISVLFQVKLCCFKHICVVLILSDIESSYSALFLYCLKLKAAILFCLDIAWNWKQPLCFDLKSLCVVFTSSEPSWYLLKLRAAILLWFEKSFAAVIWPLLVSFTLPHGRFCAWVDRSEVR